ncbi:hypothetical protein ACFSUD_11565 [Sulfitobacter aestuarii]|uniref:Uncharacterized protein n=1 Tax=Sulfitobacter aestuarii TaxID=2161676 RepID=A0ABW5U4F1_9RHOB
MSDSEETPHRVERPRDSGGPTPLGIYNRPKTELLTEIELIAIALSAVWLLGVGAFYLFAREANPAAVEAGGTLRLVMVLLAVFMPLALIWVAAVAVRASRVMREESDRLQAAIDAIRHAYIAQQQGHNRRGDAAASRRQADRSATSPVEATPPMPQPVATDPRRDPASDARPAEEQPALALGTQAGDMTPPLSKEDFIRAMNFPETAEDKEGFAALRRALKDRGAAHLIQAAQDVLTLLSQDGIYMDDLNPDRARPEVWRQFAEGARGRTIAPLGGIHDKAALAMCNGRMKQDPIFRDAAHHFLRRFDRIFAEFEKEASDSEISNLSDTRTARAFMLLGRCAGTFD